MSSTPQSSLNRQSQPATVGSNLTGKSKIIHHEIPTSVPRPAVAVPLLRKSPSLTYSQVNPITLTP